VDHVADGATAATVPAGAPVDNDLYSWMFMNNDLFAATNNNQRFPGDTGGDPIPDITHNNNNGEFKRRRSSVSAAQSLHRGVLESPLGSPASAAALAASYGFPGSNSGLRPLGQLVGGPSMPATSPSGPGIRRRQSLESGDTSGESISDAR
jgi:hypothetical protein